MTATVKVSTSERANRQLRMLRHRATELAERVRAGELQFIDAVDVAYDAAVAAGMLETLPVYTTPAGSVIVPDDLIQMVLAEAFGPVRQAAGLQP
jgi:hypothetical protein